MEIDYTIKGTNLPIIPAGTEYRVDSWDHDTNSSLFSFSKGNLISFGHKWYKDECYILCEREDYENSLYYMVKLSDIIKLTKTQETMRKIKYSDAQRIVDIACPTWTNMLFDKWGKDIVLKRDFEITDEDYQIMRKACSEAQHKVFDEIFGEDKPLKVGDWIKVIQSCGLNSKVYKVTESMLKNSLRDYHVRLEDNCSYRFPNQVILATDEEIKAANVFPDGTPCLVRDVHNGRWMLAYANGKGYFYNCIEKSGMTYTFKYSMKLDMNNLPVNE